MKKKTKKRKADYQRYFGIGLIFFVIGAATDIIPFFVIGVAFIVLALAKKNNIKKSKKDWAVYAISFTVTFVVLVGVFFYFIYPYFVNQTDECEIKNPDPDGYLLKICKYLQEHKDTVIPNKNPSEYSIKEFEEGEYQGKDVLVIRLDCCYMGDLAYVDKETKEVIGFSPGDV